MVKAALLERITQLPTPDRLEYISAVWDSIDAESIEVTALERDVLDARLKAYEEQPANG